jgi:hypothetical protein
MQNLRNADGDRATLSGRRTTPPVLALGPRPSAGAGHEYDPDELERIDPIRSAIVAAFWMLCGAGLFAAAYLAYQLVF